MKYLSTLFVALVLCFNAQAAAGDTTWVQAHNSILLDYYNDFDTTINFPDGSTKYRKIIMIFTVGKYACPGSPTYCSDWDYTVQTYAMNKVGDTIELGRLITPYGKGARMPASWQQPFYFDVTDYSTVLKDSNKIRIHYSGYSGGFTANIKFAMIEGTPDRDVKGVKPMWNGSFDFGNATNPIDEKVAAKSITAPAGTESATYRLNITGHGSDATGCSEFCQKYYRVMKDGSIVNEKVIWRDNCGFNNLYPQSGTWVYDRGNWCPGDIVHSNLHPLPGVTSGSTFDLGMTFQPYTSSGGAIYTVFGTVVYYGAINKTLDAAIEDIIAPTNNPIHFRQNPRIGYTTVKVRNTGKNVINNIEFEFGVTGETLNKTYWTGTIAPLTDTIIDLPNASSLFSALGTNIPYEVNIIKVNGAADDDASNNKFTTRFDAAAQWPATINITLRTNNSIKSGGLSETEWKITDSYGGVVAQRINNSPVNNYRDTISLPTGNYKFTVSDAGCDGVNFWANPTGGAGSVTVRNGLFVIATPGNFGGDFGCGFTQDFRVGTPTSIHEVNINGQASMSLYPNPASKEVTIDIEGVAAVNGILSITNSFGMVVYAQPTTTASNSLNTQSLSSGLYFVTYIPSQNDLPKAFSKMIIMQ